MRLTCLDGLRAFGALLTAELCELERVHALHLPLLRHEVLAHLLLGALGALELGLQLLRGVLKLAALPLWLELEDLGDQAGVVELCA